MFLLNIALILFFAKMGGFISKRLKQPAVLGEILIGVLVGPALLGLIEPNETIEHMSEIGVILLMFIAGLETDVKEMKESGKAASFIAIGGVFVPLGFTLGVALLFGMDFTSALFLGAISTATSVSITVQALREMGQLNTRQGITILSSAIIDDILGIIIITLIVASVRPTAGGSIYAVIGKIVLFFVIVAFIGVTFVKLLNKYTKIMVVGDRIITFSLIFCLGLAFVAEELGVAAITGAYFAGVTLSQTTYRNKVSYQIQNIAYSIFTPMFFVSIGFKVSFGGMSGVMVFGLTMVLMAILGKLVGCGGIARLNGFNKRESLQVGIGMVPRAEVALIVTNLGMNLSIIGQDVFTTVIIMVLSTTLITPPLLKMVFSTRESKNTLVEKIS